MMTVGQLAKRLDYEVIGNPEFEIHSIRLSNEAKKYDIGICFKRDDIETSESEVVLTQPRFISTNKTMITTYEDLMVAFLKICRILISENELPDYSKAIEYDLTTNSYYVGKNVHIGEKAYISPNVYIGDNVSIGERTNIMPGSIIGSGTIIAKDVKIGCNCVIGADAFYHELNEPMTAFVGIANVKIGRGSQIGNNTNIQRGVISDTNIGEYTMIGNLIDIGHDVKIGNHCRIVSQTGIAGNAVIGDHVSLMGQVAVNNNVHIGNGTVVKAKSFVTKTVVDNSVISGLYGRSHTEELRIQARIRKNMVK